MSLASRQDGPPLVIRILIPIDAADTALQMSAPAIVALHSAASSSQESFLRES